MSDITTSDPKNDDIFYRSFEERFRGSRQLIKGRLQVYRPFLGALHEAGLAGKAVDLGCGRGEWLEVLQDAGFQAQGVDLDEGMLAACYERDLPAVYGNALEFLSTLPDVSQSVVSGFHIAEHLSFDDLRKVVEETFRVLTPGGLLILETPNPENLRVSTLTFHLDPTHNRPIPPDLMEFLAVYNGYSRHIILRLQAEMDLDSFKAREDVGLSIVLEGISPDYALVAQKPADESVENFFKESFSREVGISYGRAVSKFDENIISRVDKVRRDIDLEISRGLSEKIDVFQSEISAQVDQCVSSQLKRAREEIGTAFKLYERQLLWQVSNEMSARINHLESEVAGLRELLGRQSGRSDAMGRLLRKLRQGSSAWLLLKPGSRPRRVAGRLARAGAGYLRDKPRAKSAAIRLTALVPSLQARLFRLAAEQRAAMPELDVLTGREWYLDPEPAVQAKWAALLGDRPATNKADG
ncbi:methyltransferase domain-containing protein [Aurantimonas aggregata]|uniref:Methyltransferase domain-containing protein n=1 Tax=Aurantimonas aggregata TaxID=2047720 RepID=A0A6L9MJ62_9HYPH|nr:class I SAM-dependent methyltransferase [Aurantimonas aggregata]NDV87924.1 methyltransferase domain-containing protein [Aurantimonas aggregata]